MSEQAHDAALFAIAFFLSVLAMAWATWRDNQ
jgi:hypothetical protein